jgi:hypothetical protein
VPGCILYGGGYQEARAVRAAQPNILNAEFTDGSAWSLGTGWSIADGKATHAAGAGGNLTQDVFVIGNRYSVPWTLNSSNMVQMLIGSASVGPNRGPGSFVEEMTCTGSATLFVYPETRACVLESVGVGARNLSLQSYTPAFTTIPGSVLAQATPTAQPWVSSDGLGIRYKGGDMLQWSAAASAVKCLHDGTGGTLIVAVRPSVVNAVNVLAATCTNVDAAAVGAHIFFTATEAKLIVGNGTGIWSINVDTPAAFSAGNTYVFTLRIASGDNNARLRVNGASILTTTLNAPSAADPQGAFRIGAQSAGSTQNVDGIIGHPFVANRVLTDAECTAVENYILAQATL